MLSRIWVSGWLHRCVAAGVLLSAGYASAVTARGKLQTPKSNESGLCALVVDDAGVAIVGAQIEVGSANAIVARVRMAGAGACVRVRLAPGQYVVTAKAQGFASVAAMPVQVRAGEFAAVHSVLKVEQAAVLESMEQHLLAGENVPVEQRDAAGYLPLTPTANAVPDVERDPEQDRREWMSVRGLAAAGVSSELNGMPYNQALDGGGRGAEHAASGAMGYSTEVVQRFSWNAGEYAARNGGAPGAVVNAVAGRGIENGRVHGTGYFFLQSNLLNATNPYSIASSYNATTATVTESPVKPEDLRLQWGLDLGGTLRRGRVDWFLGYDQMHRNFPVISSPASPTFFNLTAQQTAKLANRGVTATQTGAAIEYLASFTGQSPREERQWDVMPRVDWQWRERERFSVLWNGLHTDGPASGTQSPVVARAANGIGSSELSLETGAAKWVHFITENLASEFRAQYAYEWVQEFATYANAGPQVSMGVGGMSLGTASYLPRTAYPKEHALQMAETVTWVHGKHTVEAGASWMRTAEQIDALRYSNGSFTYNNVVDWISDFTYNYTKYHAGTAAVDGVCGTSGSNGSNVPPGSNPTIAHYECFSLFTQAFGNDRLEFDVKDWAGYVQEDWRLAPRLTVNAGVRYEYEQLPRPQLPDAALDTAFAGIGSTSIYPADKNNFAPRIGVAWDPRGKGRDAIRAGYGIFYGRILNATLETALQNTGLPTCTGSTAEHCQLSVTPEKTEDTLNGYPNIFANYAATAGIAPSQYTRSVIVSGRFRVPIVQQGEVAVEHELGRWMTLSGEYLVSMSRQLPNLVDANIAPAPSTGTVLLQGGPVGGAQGTYNGETFLVPVYQTRLNSNYGPVSNLVSNINGYYDAVVLEATRRLQRGIGFDVHWTWSKAVDYGQTIGGLGVASGSTNDNQFDPYQIGYDRGLSSFNVPHKIVGAVVWQPKWPADARRVREAVNGWEWTPLFVEQSGYAYSYNIYGGSSLAGGHQSINRSGGAKYLPTVGRNTLRMPDVYTVNLRLARHFVLRNQMRMEVIAECYNLANHRNEQGLVTTAYQVQPQVSGQPVTLTYQDAAQTSTPFGQFIASATARYAERQMQVGVRVHF